MNIEESFLVTNSRLLNEGTSEIPTLLTTIRAINANSITRNKTYYPKKALMGEADKGTGYYSMISPYPIPVITHHLASPGFLEAKDPVGRIKAARFVNEKGGYLECVAEITDPDAIEKVTSQRYLTVSIGASCEEARCSICNSQLEYGECPSGHMVGNFYNVRGMDKECYTVVDGIRFREISFVNVPSDPEARVLSIESNQGMLKHSIKDKEGYRDITSSSYQLRESIWSDGLDSTEVEVESPNTLEEGHMDNPKTEPEEKVEFVSAGTLYSLSEDNPEYGESCMSKEDYSNLSASSFCGPKRTFPAHDKVHILKGLSLLPGSNLSESTKAKAETRLKEQGIKKGLCSSEAVVVLCSGEDVLELNKEAFSKHESSLIGLEFSEKEASNLRTLLKLSTEEDERLFGAEGVLSKNPAVITGALPVFRFVESLEEFRDKPSETKEEMNTEEYYKLLDEYDSLESKFDTVKQELETVRKEMETLKTESVSESEYHSLLVKLVAEQAVLKGTYSEEEALQQYQEKTSEVLRGIFDENKESQSKEVPTKVKDVKDPRALIESIGKKDPASLLSDLAKTIMVEDFEGPEEEDEVFGTCFKPIGGKS